MGRTPKYSEEEVAAAFSNVKDAPNEQLTCAYAQEHYDWFYSAVTHYGKKPYDWYGALEKLYELHGGMTPEQAKQKMKEIRRAGKCGGEYSYTEQEVKTRFLGIKDAPNEELKRAYAQKHYKWYSSACTRYGEGKHDWYGALEKLYELHGGMTKDKAKQKVEEIKQKLVKRGRKLKYNELQIAEKFLRIKDAPNERLTLAYAIEHYKWRTSACTHCGKKPSDWYGLLEELFTQQGGMSSGQARIKVEEVRRYARIQRSMRISIALKDKRQISDTPANRERKRQFAGGAGQAQGRAARSIKRI